MMMMMIYSLSLFMHVCCAGKKLQTLNEGEPGITKQLFQRKELRAGGKQEKFPLPTPLLTKETSELAKWNAKSQEIPLTQKNKPLDECLPFYSLVWGRLTAPGGSPRELPAADALPDSQKLAGIKQKHVLPGEGNGQQVGSQTLFPSRPPVWSSGPPFCGHWGPEWDIFPVLCWTLFKCNYTGCRCGIDDLEVPHKLNFEASLKLH